jgi:outer membrane protein OmpA-like peptidoglycan-associated protein
MNIKPLAAAVSLALLVGACATPQSQAPTQSTPSANSAFSAAGCPLAPERPVESDKKVIGAVVGAVAGAVVGKAVSKKSGGAVVGAGLGGLFGYLVGSNIAVKEQADGSVLLDIPGAALFDTGKSNIKPQFADTLGKISQTLQDNPNTIVCVIGFTDAVGTDTNNQRLSEDRSRSVTAFLTSRGVSGDRLTSAGLGERFPVGDNNTETGRTQNRRVEMYVRN